MDVFITLLVIVVLVLVGLGLLGRSLAGRAPQEAKTTGVPPPEPRPSAAPGRGGMASKPVRLSANGRLAVVGESHYQRALRSIVGSRDAQGFENAVPAKAVLVPEPGNRHDRNAVRVDIDGQTVGYIAREDASAYQQPLLELARRDQAGWCPAFIACGSERIFGVWLSVAPADRLVPANSADGLDLLPSERTVTVTGEELHQEALTEVARRAGGRESLAVFASLGICVIAKGKHKGEQGVEVLIDGLRVGEMTWLQSDRYVERLRAVIAQGRTPGCDATVVSTPDKGWQVELQMPRPD